MNRKSLYFTIAAVAVAALLLTASRSDYYYRLNKSFEVFGALIRELSENYVVDLDPEDLVRDAIQGSLKNLDPYTEYLEEQEKEDIDLITTGVYTGFGITVSNIDSILTIIDVREGYPAFDKGLRIGDRLLSIDTTNVYYLSSDNLRTYSKGPIGSKSIVSIVRPGTYDTLSVELARKEIKVENVSYTVMLNDTIGYVKLDRFSKNSSQETLEAINSLNRNNDLKGLILDLRDNPGGLLEAAVSISEIFVSKDSPIVTTRGRGSRSNEKVYRAFNNPVYPNLPLAVLINEYSASASEILAGAMQDLDRGIIVGQRSFGKGLVQSVFELPYNSSVKITTSRYYTPSGRSIQKLDYNSKRNSVKESPKDSIFTTKNGRRVFELNGISPDSLVKQRELPDFIEQVYQKGLFFDFTNIYTAKLTNISFDFKADEKLLAEFAKYLEDKNFSFKDILMNKADEFAELAEKNMIKDKINPLLKQIRELVTTDNKSLVNKYKSEVSDILTIDILRRFYSDKRLFTKTFNKDNQLMTALSLLSISNYNSILAKNQPQKNKQN